MFNQKKKRLDVHKKTWALSWLALCQIDTSWSLLKGGNLN